MITGKELNLIKSNGLEYLIIVKNKLNFVASPFSIEAVNLLKKLGCKTFKIASGEVTNYLMIDEIIKQKKEVILSSGLSSFRELDKTVERIKK